VTSPVELPWNKYPVALCLPMTPPPPASEPEQESPELPVFLDYGRDI